MHSPITIHPAGRLLAGAQPSLVDWYGEPMRVSMAVRLRARAQQTLQERLCGDGGVFPLHVLQLVCDFWQRPEGSPGHSMPATGGDRRARALLELVTGQLLMSRKLHHAGEHLAYGFRLASPWLSSTEYFTLLRRHERLAALRLTAGPAPAQGLRALLAEASVIRRLRGGCGPRVAAEHRDTVG